MSNGHIIFFGRQHRCVSVLEMLKRKYNLPFGFTSVTLNGDGYQTLQVRNKKRNHPLQ